MPHIFAEMDFVVSGFIGHIGCCRSSDAVLMIKHRKLGVWLPPGGHIEIGETPNAAIEREILEETGLKLNKDFAYVNTGGFKLDNSNADVASGRIQPYYTPWAVDCHPFDPLPGHKHLCLIYLFRDLSANDVIGNATIISSDSGIEDVRWMNFQALDHELREQKLWASVYDYCKEALRTLFQAYGRR